MARALVKADLYYNWRCANYGSVPRDLMPDLYHLVNAVYCDIYATAESKHARLAPLVLTSKTSVAIYDESGPVDDWLVGLLTLSA